MSFRINSFNGFDGLQKAISGITCYPHSSGLTGSYTLKPLIRAMRHMHDSELKLAIIIGIMLCIAGLLDLLARRTI
jgi:hypothetical protein